MIYKRTSYWAGTVAGDADQVVGTAPVPRNGRVLSVSGELHMVGAEGANITEFSGFGFGGELVPALDLEDVIDVNVLWDRMVVKGAQTTEAAATATFDFDVDDADTEPQIEPGDVNPNKLMGLATPSKTIINPRLHFDSFARNKGGWVAGSPDVYNPSRFMTFNGRRTLAADMPSYGLLAVSSPLFDVESTSESTFSNSRFAILENLREQIHWAVQTNLGNLETGAESPFNSLSALIEDIVSPPVVQPASALIITQTWSFMCVAHWVLDSGGSHIPSTLEAF